MSRGVVTVGIPVKNGSRYLPEVLSALAEQQVDRDVDLLVLDSGSTDGSVGIARRGGARVIEMDPKDFSHGGARNLIMSHARGDHVAFLTQDATPRATDWLERLLEGFELADDVALTFGPYAPRPEATLPVRRELTEFFESFAPDGLPVVQRLATNGGPDYRRRPGPLTFFTDANGCVARWAWDQIPYREAAYAEDQLLACELLEAGYAKVYVPDAAVVHSHEYSYLQLMRRCFDEWRGLLEVYGHVESGSPRLVVGRIAREVAADRRFMRTTGGRSGKLWRETFASVGYHLARTLGSLLGSRADRLPPVLRRRLSLEGRDGYSPVARMA